MLRERGVVYDPEELSFLGGLFDQAVASLPVIKRTPANRTEIAKIILGLAAAGELAIAFVLRDDGCTVLGEKVECITAAHAIIAAERLWRDAPNCIMAVALKNELAFDGYQTTQELRRLGRID